jgi:hypothetical protein
MRNRHSIAAGVVAFPFTLGSAETLEEIVRFLPVLLILLGGGLLLRPMVRGTRG